MSRLDAIAQDLRYGIRSFRRSPGFTALAIATLALGIGAVTVIYSVIQHVLLDPFPYRDSSRLVDVMVQRPTGGILRGSLVPSEFLDYQTLTDVFDDVAGTTADGATLTTREGAVRVMAATVTPNVFDFLGVPAMLGRAPAAADTPSGDQQVVAIAHKLWLVQFGGAPDIIGRAITIDGRSYTIVAVMPPRFGWHIADLWIPRPIDRADETKPEGRRWFQAHLKPGVTLQQAEAQLAVIAAQRARVHPDDYPAQSRVVVIRVIDWVVRGFRGVLYALFAAVALLLLIACCNVANMLLARATSREREMTLRAALGATRGRLVRQLLVESALLAAGGAIGGALLAYLGLKGLLLYLPRTGNGIAAEMRIVLDGWTLLVSLGISALTAIGVGLLPALQGTRRDLVSGLKDSGKGTSGSGARHGHIRNGLVIAEIALSLALLVGAGLLMRTFVALTRVSLGFSADRILLAVPTFPSGTYTTAAQQLQFSDQLRRRIATIPGVVAVAESDGVAGLGSSNSPLEIAGKVHTEAWQTRVERCSEGYLDLLGVRLVRGRALTAFDIAGARHVALVNERFVARYFGHEDPLGKTITLARLARDRQPVADPTFEIVGVVGDFKNGGVRDPIDPEVLLPTSIGGGTRFLFARTSVDPLQVAEEVRRQIWQLNPAVAMSRPTSLGEQLDAYAFEQPRFSTLVLGAFAVAGLLLVAVGVYGVMAYGVARRTQEIAIRVALGGERRHVLRLILRQGLTLVAAGIGVGLLLSVLVTSIVRANWADPMNMPTDHWTTAAAVIVIVAIGLLACYWPARRALHVDPLVALRRD